MSEALSVHTKYLRNLWEAREASGLAPLEQLRYRSNRLGDDLRITNFGGGNTSSKFDLPDPLTGATVTAAEVQRNALTALNDRFATMAANVDALPD